MAASHQTTPTPFSFCNTAPATGGIDDDDLLRAQRLLGGGSGGGEVYRQAWDAGPGLVRRPGPPAYAPAPAMARYREEMMEMVRRGGAPGSARQDPVVYYELSLRDLVELPSAARALREGAAVDHPQSGGRQVQAGEELPQAPALGDEEVAAWKMASKKDKEKETEKPSKTGRKRDVFRGHQALESGVFMLKMFFVLPAGVFGGSGRQRKRELAAAAAAGRSKVTPAPKAVWCDEDRSVEEEAWEDCHHRQPKGKTSRSSSGGGNDGESCSNSPGRRRRRFASCYSFLHANKRRSD